MTYAKGLTVIGASAGTGKTQRLTEIVWNAVRPRSASDEGERVAPEQLAAVTFTEKAAGELADRIRTKLFAENAADEALRLSLAYLGTVHSVGLRLIRESAFEAGYPLDFATLSEDGGRLLRTLFERAVPLDRQERLEVVARRLEIAWDTRQKHSRWVDEVFKIVDAARANRIPISDLASMANRSWSSLKAHLPPADNARDLDAELHLAGRSLLASGTDGSDRSGTAEALSELAAALTEITLSGAWSCWQKIANLTPTKKAVEAFRPIRAIAAAHVAHPSFQSDIETYLTEAFAAAADVLTTFAMWKAERRVLDWNDMLDLALTALETPVIAEDLRTRLGLVVVDELQDSGPLQLAMFARLHEIAGRSVWVGDPKQCIFEWNGADPALMDALLADVAGNGGATDRLQTNYRSRAQLVEACSALFASAFARMGLPASDVVVQPCAARLTEPAELALLPPLGVSFIDPGGAGSAADQLADTVAGFLAKPAETPVLDRATNMVRPVSAADIAVLLATNDECESLAVALRARGIPATAACSGLVGTLEGRATQAALRLLIAGDETLAEAELEALAGFSAFGDVPDSAREKWLGGRASATADTSALPARGRWTKALDVIRTDLPALSPSAALDRVFDALDLSHAVLSWEPTTDGRQRQANLDALRRLARTYEAETAGGATAATLSGLLRFLTAAPDVKDRDAQHTSDGSGCVVVTTYHRAKGLEWPVVILGSLNKSSRRTAFDVWAESSEPPSLTNPLNGRWIRYWPWPYGAMRKSKLTDDVAAGPVGVQVTERERRERLRLLYVGFTRARDHLSLAIPRNKDALWQHAWLDELQSDGRPLLALPTSGNGAARIRGPDGQTTLTCRLNRRSSTRFNREPARAFSRVGTVYDRPPRRIAPSYVSDDEIIALGGQPLRVAEVVALGEPLFARIKGGDHVAERVGLAMHGFLASDSQTIPMPDRLDCLERWLYAYDLREKMSLDAIVESADRFWSWVAARWPGARLRPEIPIRARLGTPNVRVLGGTIDLLVEREQQWVVIDHKTSHKQAAPHVMAAPHRAQLAAYRLALHRVSAETPGQPHDIATWLHFPMTGTVIELIPS